MKLRDLWDSVVNTASGLCELLVISAAAGFIMGSSSERPRLRLRRVPGCKARRPEPDPAADPRRGCELILGMGLPTIGGYVMLGILVAPALVKVGVPPLAAHLFILYFGMMSLITPPVAPAAYVAAAIAGSPSMATGWTANAFSAGSPTSPFLFVYSPAILMQAGPLGHCRRDPHLPGVASG